MRSVTSYFNGTLYRKTLARYWPLWAAYGVIWMFCIPLNMLNMYFSRYMSSAPAARLFIQAINLPEYATAGLYLAAFSAILCAMAVFGYLYSSRSSCWFHALPMRREALFTTQYLAGLSFLLLPQLAAAALTAVVEISLLPMGQWGAALSALLTWLLAQSGICLFFFSFAAFCAMFTGHILALPAFYGILNALASGIYFLINGLMHEFFYGYVGSDRVQTIVEYLTPCVALKDALVLFVRSDAGGYYYRSSATIAAYTVVGVVLAFSSLYVYRRRHAETAGDVVAIPLVRPLFKYGVSFCVGLCFGMFTTAFFGWSNIIATLIPCVMVWSVVGYFAAEMLLKKSFRVLKAWKGAVIMPAVLLVLCLACELDLFGMEARVPKLDQIKQVSVSFDTGYPSDSGGIFSEIITDPEEIQQFLTFHQAIVDSRDQLNTSSRSYTGGEGYTFLHLQYELENGSTLRREYNSIPICRDDLDKEGSVTWLVQQLVQDRDLIARAYDFEGRMDSQRLTGAWLDQVLNADGQEEYYVYVDDYAQLLWDAVQQDFAEGTIGVRYLFYGNAEQSANTYRTELTFGLEPIRSAQEDGSSIIYDSSSTQRYSGLSITLTPNARHTLAVLEATGIFEQGYSLYCYEDFSESNNPLAW